MVIESNLIAENGYSGDNKNPILSIRIPMCFKFIKDCIKSHNQPHFRQGSLILPYKNVIISKTEYVDDCDFDAD
jgi:hypothetical protein